MTRSHSHRAGGGAAALAQGRQAARRMTAVGGVYVLVRRCDGPRVLEGGGALQRHACTC
jgi:hypothetical protein